jgi:hypothetical protein
MRLLTRTLLVLPLLAATAAFAAAKPVKKEASFGAGKATGAYLTRAQLRGCLTQQDDVKVDDADLVKEQTALASQKEQIARSGDELKARLETVDHTNADAVTAYNVAVQARDRQIDDYQARVTAFNTRVDANQTAHRAFNQGCSNRRYFEEDEAAVRRGK